jgi:hypothetical protein
VTAFVEAFFELAGLLSAAFEECCAAAVMGIRRPTTSKTNDHFFIGHPLVLNEYRNTAILEL